jgi:hypothetical protein
MHPFEAYLKQHNLEALMVSVVAKVRYITVWNATKGNPITPDHARKLHQAVFNLTGVAYTGSFTLLQAQPSNQSPVLPRRNVPRQEQTR